MSERKGDAALAALAVVGTAVTIGGFAVAVALSRRVAERALPPSRQPIPTEIPPPPRDFSDEDVDAAARMLASEDGQGSPQLWTELIGSQLHARKAGETLYARITAGSGYGRQGERSWSGRTRPVSTDQEALPMHRSWAREVLSGLHTPRFESAIAFFDPAQQDKAYAVAQRRGSSKRKVYRSQSRRSALRTTARPLRRCAPIGRRRCAVSAPSTEWSFTK